MKTLTTERLNIRPLNLNDAGFILELFNTEDFIKYIGDKEIRTLEDANNYLISGPLKMYKDLGLGLCMVETKNENEALGICGLIKRDSLDDIDVGFGFLPKHYHCGYGYESTKALLESIKGKFRRIVAITNSNNISSIKLLEKLGFCFEKNIEKITKTIDLRLYGINFNDH
jgi:RimJ/RimL family protein N-acetyltransferase